MSLELVTLPSEFQELIEQVRSAVRARTGGRIHGLSIRIDDGCLVLTGRTSTYYNKQLATHAALDAALEMSVQNNVEVC
jgi:hypothetical protein